MRSETLQQKGSAWLGTVPNDAPRLNDVGKEGEDA